MRASPPWHLLRWPVLGRELLQQTAVGAVDLDGAGAIAAARPESGTDLLIGIGGTPEGITSPPPIIRATWRRWPMLAFTRTATRPTESKHDGERHLC